MKVAQAECEALIMRMWTAVGVAEEVRLSPSMEAQVITLERMWMPDESGRVQSISVGGRRRRSGWFQTADAVCVLDKTAQSAGNRDREQKKENISRAFVFLKCYSNLILIKNMSGKP